jgi:hypothetical protein
MPSFYEEMRDVAKELTTEFKTGTVTLKRPTGTLPGPEVAYSPFTQTYDEYSLNACVFGVSADYVDGEQVLADDLMVYTSPIATLGSTDVTLDQINMSDEVTIDDNVHVVNKIERIPAAGIASMYIIFVKR